MVNIQNSTIQFWTRAGVNTYTARLGRNGLGSIVGSFFEPLNPANILFDPKVLYDHYSNRFMVVALEQVANPQTSRILLAVSDDGDPNGTWYFQAINSLLTISGLTTWADYPGFAFDQQAIYVCTNQFRFSTGAFGGNRVWVVNKANLYANAPSAAAVYDPAAVATPDPNLGGMLSTTMQPSVMFGAPPAGVGTFIVAYSGINAAGQDYLQVIRLDDPLGAITFTGQFVLMGDVDNNGVPTLTRTPQFGSAIRIDTGDRRALQSLWRNGHLYTIFDLMPVAGADVGQCTAHWLKTSTASLAALAVADQGNVGAEDLGAGTNVAYPSLAVNSRGDMAVGFAAGNASIYCGAYYTGRTTADPAGTVQSTGTLATGVDFYVRTFTAGSTGRNRWGDYTSTVVDPADDCAFWHFNEFAMARGNPTTVGGTTEDGQWRMRMGNWTFNCLPVAVELAWFTADRGTDGALLRWKVTEAVDHAGFNVWRGEEGNRVQLNGSLLTGSDTYEFVDAGAPASGASYWLEEISRSGGSAWHGPVTLEPAAVRVPVAALAPGQPNPFRGNTTLAYSVAARGPVHLSVFDAAGRKVATLVDGVMDAGSYTATWDGQSSGGSLATAGFYIVRLETGGRVMTQKVVLSR